MCQTKLNKSLQNLFNKRKKVNYTRLVAKPVIEKYLNILVTCKASYVVRTLKKIGIRFPICKVA